MVKLNFKKIKISLFINLLALSFAVFFGIFLKEPSVAGVIILIGVIVISSFFNSKTGLIVGAINIPFVVGIAWFYFQSSQKSFEWRHFLGTLPLFLLGGYFSGKYNEMKEKYRKELEEEIAKRTKELREAKRKLEEAKTVLEIRVRARTRQLQELVENQEKVIQERTKELQKRIAELERFRQLTVGRELKMAELKKEIKKLKEKLAKKK